MQRDDFQEQLLRIMEKKVHWAWPGFTQGLVPKDKLHIHFEQEYATYVRDFPVMVGWAYVQCPVADVRQDLSENLYEEETGGIVAGKPHPELFLEYPRGLGMDMSRFEHVELLPAARQYRDCLDDLTQRRGWEVAAAVATIFIEGTQHERGEVDGQSKRRSMPPLENHPLVQHYGLPVASLALTKAHRRVEGSHRKSAWHCVVNHTDAEAYSRVLQGMAEALEHWLSYRDEIALHCGLSKGADGTPQRT